MRVDMSPPAVTARLQELDELWELCVELMKAKPQQREASVFREQSSLEDFDTTDDHRASKQLEVATE